jgi:septal ring factor EnvC (AmiA/AmiB activator)
LNKDLEKLKRNSQREILEIKSPYSQTNKQTKKPVEGHSSRVEQVEDRTSELEDKIEIKENTEEISVKQLKNCERNMQELSNSIKRPNLGLWALKTEKWCKPKGYVTYSIT